MVKVKENTGENGASERIGKGKCERCRINNHSMIETYTYTDPQ